MQSGRLAGASRPGDTPPRGEKRDATVYGAQTCIRVGACTRSQAVVVARCVRFQQRDPSAQMRGTG